MLRLIRCQNSQKKIYISRLHTTGAGPRSVVVIATGYGLDGPGIESRWEARFSAPVQTDLGAHPASCAMGTVSFLEVKSSRGVTLTPSPPSSAVGRERVELYLYSRYGPYGLYRVSVSVQGWPLPLHYDWKHYGTLPAVWWMHCLVWHKFSVR
jgi:hypothetical protein